MSLCAACSTENPAEARFCMGCGGALERRCPSCGAPAPGGGALLHGLRAPVAAAARPEPAAAPNPDVGGAAASPPVAAPTLDERRTVTVLFADLSGYTAVAARLDPESVKRQLERILGRLGEEVRGVRRAMSTSSSATT